MLIILSGIYTECTVISLLRLSKSIRAQTPLHLSYRNRFQQWGCVKLLSAYGMLILHELVKPWIRINIGYTLFCGFLFSSSSSKNTSGVIRVKEQNTATYCTVITESGELSLELGDMDIHQKISEEYVCATGFIKINIVIDH